MTHVNRISKHDDFYTPKWAVDILLDYYNFNDKIIWECASGIGNITDVIKPHCKKVFETDIKEGQDFLAYKPYFDYDYIITNPPFSLKTEFIQKCIEHDKNFYLLLPLTNIEGIKKRKIITESNYHLTILLPDRRVQYTDNNKVTFASAWFCFNKINVFEVQRIEMKLVDSDKYIKGKQ